MAETIGGYLRRRYRWALAAIVGGALWVAARTRCPRCRTRFADRLDKVLPLMVQFSLGTPRGRCPHCGARLDLPYR